MSLPAYLLLAAVVLQADWRDPSPHSIQFVTVEKNVRIEVLDWGGKGPAIILLAGSGNTAHVFDEFAPKLTPSFRVFGITRRGFGNSSQPETGYDEPRLAADIWQVIDRLHIPSPVVLGHSMAGGEITILGTQHSDRLKGLVYLDALFDVADFPASDPKYLELAKKLPVGAPPPAPTKEDQTSFAAYRVRQMRIEGFAFPESELHTGSEPMADGSKGKYKTPQRIFKLIGDGAKARDYSKIGVPVLAINNVQPRSGEYGPDDHLTKEEREATDAFRAATDAFNNRWYINLLNGPPAVTFVGLEGAGHYLFLTKEAEVIQALQAFMKSLN